MHTFPAFTLLVLLFLAITNANAQLVVQTPSELGLNPTEVENMLEKPQHADPSFPQFEMLGLQEQQQTPGPRLADCLTVERKLSLFYEYAREVGPVMKRIVSPTVMTTLLVPVNQAIIALPHKPHQDPEDGDGVLVSEVKTRNNVERFVRAHTIASAIPWPVESGATYESMLGEGHRITFRTQGDQVVVQPGEVKVLAMKEASNGRVIYLDGIVGY